jgi:hypothetical protein
VENRISLGIGSTRKLRRSEIISPAEPATYVLDFQNGLYTRDGEPVDLDTVLGNAPDFHGAIFDAAVAIVPGEGLTSFPNGPGYAHEAALLGSLLALSIQGVTAVFEIDDISSVPTSPEAGSLSPHYFYISYFGEEFTADKTVKVAGLSIRDGVPDGGAAAIWGQYPDGKTQAQGVANLAEGQLNKLAITFTPTKTIFALNGVLVAPNEHNAESYGTVTFALARADSFDPDSFALPEGYIRRVTFMPPVLDSALADLTA